MSSKGNQPIIMRVAEEAQLLAEEKWIIDALKKIKRQRNSLQIEKLNLENLKAKLKSGDEQRCREGSVALSPYPSQSSALNMMQQKPNTSTHIEFELPAFGMEETCNAEELNLAVTNSVFNDADTGSFDIEEDDEDMENCVIDMNMLMYGNMAAPSSSGDRALDD